MIWIGHMYPYQAAMMAGGVLLTLAAGLKFFLRVSQGTQIQADGV
jgi:hypothetical protein